MSDELFNVQKYAKTRKMLKIFESDTGLVKVMEKVKEFEELKRVRTLNLPL